MKKPNFEHGKTCAYTICKNEIKNIDTWYYYASTSFDYYCILDTGSTDGTWERLQELAEKDPNFIIEQKTFIPWNFSDARNYNLSMIPDDVTWCLSPDVDEWFSINVINEMNKVITHNPMVTNISTTRLDIYSEEVFVGPPHQLPSNKIHRKNVYKWVSPIYEHLIYCGNGNELELYSEKIFLVHNQDFMKKERSPLYLKMLVDEYEKNPSNCWTLWFLVNHYYTEKDFDNFVKTACDFIKFHTQFDKKYDEVLRELTNIYLHYKDCPVENKLLIESVIRGRSI